MILRSIRKISKSFFFLDIITKNNILEKNLSCYFYDANTFDNRKLSKVIDNYFSLINITYPNLFFSIININFCNSLCTIANLKKSFFLDKKKVIKSNNLKLSLFSFPAFLPIFLNRKKLN